MLVVQNAQQLSQIECDAQLGAVFQARSIKLSSLSDRITNHLRLVEPLTLRYTVRYNVPAATPFLCSWFVQMILCQVASIMLPCMVRLALHGQASPAWSG